MITSYKWVCCLFLLFWIQLCSVCLNEEWKVGHTSHPSFLHLSLFSLFDWHFIQKEKKSNEQSHSWVDLLHLFIRNENQIHWRHSLREEDEEEVGEGVSLVTENKGRRTILVSVLEGEDQIKWPFPSLLSSPLSSLSLSLLSSSRCSKRSWWSSSTWNLLVFERRVKRENVMRVSVVSDWTTVRTWFISTTKTKEEEGVNGCRSRRVILTDSIELQGKWENLSHAFFPTK